MVGLTLALFQVQGWKMPTALAVFLLVILFGLLALSLGTICLAGIKAIRQIAEHRAVSASWVSDEVPGLLDYEADGERAANRFTKELKRFAIDTERLGKILILQTKRMQDLTRSGKTIKGTDKQKRGNQAGKVIDRSAIYIEKRVELFKVLVKDIARNYDGLIAAITINTEEDRFTAKHLVVTLESTGNITAASVVSMETYRDSVRSIQKQNLSRTVRIASKRLGDGLDNIITLFKQFQDNCCRLHTELASKIANVDSSNPDK